MSNAITGFAVLQAIAYLYATEKKEIWPQIRSRWIFVCIMIVFFHGLYIFAVNWCHTNILDNLKDVNPHIVNANFKTTVWGIKLGQTGIIVAFGLFALFITLSKSKQDTGK